MSTSSDQAREWTQGLAHETLEPLLSDRRGLLLGVPWVAASPDPELAGSALILWWATNYLHGRTPDALIDSLALAAGEDRTPLDRDHAKALVLLAMEMVRAGALPEPRWWDPIRHAEHMAIAVSRAFEAGSDELRLLLERRLPLGSEMAAEVLKCAALPPGFEYEVDFERAGGAGGRLARMLEHELVASAAAKAEEGLDKSAASRRDLAAAKAWRLRLQLAHRAAREGGDEELAELLEREAKRFSAACAGLSSLELELMRPVDADEELLMRAARLAKRVVALTPEQEPVGPPDLIDGVREMPRGLELYLGLAGQTHQQRLGGIISWTITFERFAPEGLREEGFPVGLAITDAPGVEFQIETSLDGEKVYANVYYPAGSAFSALDLAVLALTGHPRLDFFVLGRNRAICHISQGEVVLDERMLPQIATRAASACRELLAAGEEAALQRVRQEISGDEAPVIAFLMNDSGKSEQLLEASSPQAALGPNRQASPDEEEELRCARRTLLTAEAQRIEHPSPQAQHAAVAAEGALLATVQTIRGPRERSLSRRARREHLEGLLDGVVGEDRAFAHLTIDARGLEVAWADRAGGTTEIALLPLAEVDLDELRAALRDPEAGSVALLDEAGGAGVALGSALAAQARDRGVTQVLVSPTRFLHQLPLHALRTDETGECRLIDLLEVVYAPSCAIAASLEGAPMRDGPTVIAAVGLEHAGDEASLTASLAGEVEVLAGGAATPAALIERLSSASRLHVCTHGAYVPDDYLASRFVLAPDVDDVQGWLTSARLLAEAQVRGLDLAVLGACQSGAGNTAPSSLDVPGGIDSAFLAAGVRNVVSALWEIDDLGALLFHAEFYRSLAAGDSLFSAYSGGVGLLRSGAWKEVRNSPLGTVMESAGIDLDAAFAQLEEDGHGDDGEDLLDFSELQHWAPYRLCGLGRLRSDND